MTKLISKIRQEYLNNIERARPNPVFVGLLGFFGFTIYYFTWYHFFPQQYENIALMVFCSFLFLPFIFYFQFPEKIKDLFPHFYFFVLFFCLPFFTSFMLVKNGFSELWIMSFLCTIFLLINLISGYVSVLLMILSGFFLACIAVLLMGGSISFVNFGYKYLLFYFFALISGIVCNYHAEIHNQAKVQKIKAFGGSIAHEMRNPLNSINLLLLEAKEIFNDSNQNQATEDNFKKADEIFTTMLNCIKRANNIIDIILSNIRNEKASNPANEILSVNELINQAVKEYGYRSNEEKQKVKTELGEDFLIKGEKSTFIYILFNLIKNALYYYETAPNFTVTIKTIKANSQNQFNQIIVKDTGPGIAEDKISSLFQPFNTNNKQGGTGLGLNFVYNTIKAMDGEIKCNSKLGEFTEFVINLPTCNEPKETKQSLPPKATFIDHNFNGKKILIIDDDMLQRKLVRKILENNFNLKVIEANNGKSALETLKTEPGINLIFTDINMPIMDGYEFSENLHQNQEYRQYQNLPIIALTSSNDQETLAKIHNYGMSQSLIKGFDKGSLNEVLSKALGN